MLLTRQRGGTGSTMIAASVASFLARMAAPVGKAVCLVDATLECSDSGMLFNRYHPNAGDVLAVRDEGRPWDWSITPDALAVGLAQPIAGLALLQTTPIPEHPRWPDLQDPGWWAAAVEAAATAHDYVIVLPPTWHDLAIQQRLVELADVALCTVPASEHAALLARDALTQVEASLPCVVVGQTPARSGIDASRAEMADALGRSVDVWVPWTDRVWRRDFNDRRPASTLDRASVCQPLTELIGALFGIDGLGPAPHPAPTMGRRRAFSLRRR